MAIIQLGLFGEQIDLTKPQKAKYKRLTHYAVVELGPDSCVWGVGKSRQTAISDAAAACVEYPGIDIDDADDFSTAIQAGEMVVTRCTRRLFKKVCTYGGEIDFAMVQGAGVFLPIERENNPCNP